MLRKTVLLASVFSLFVTGLLVCSGQDPASGETVVYCDPELVQWPFDATEGFTVDIYIQDVENLYGYEMQVRWDSSALNLANGWIRPFVFDYTNDTITLFDIHEDYAIAVGMLLGSDAKPFSGSGPLCHLAFTILQAGSAGEFPIEIDGDFLDFDGNDIDVSFRDCIFRRGTVIPPGYIVIIEPRVMSWYAEYEPCHLIGFHVYANNCNVTIPLTAEMSKGPFAVVVDESWETNFTVSYNDTHATMQVYFDSDGVHNVKIYDSLWGDITSDGIVNILDIAAVAIQFGKEFP